MRVLAAVWLVAWLLVGVPWSSFSLQPSIRNVRMTPFQDGSPRSQLLNVLAFVPCGIFAVGLGWSAARALLSGVVISAATEFVQLFSSSRYPSMTDLILNSAGTAIGVGIAAAGQPPGRRRENSRRRVNG